METITIERDLEREQEISELSKEQLEAQRQALLDEFGKTPQPSQSAVEKTNNPLTEDSQAKTGTVVVDDFYAFQRFNQNGEYREVKDNSLQQGRKALSNALLPNSAREHVFENKQDGTKIDIRKNKIMFNNTERNYQAALDIAQDKGWSAIVIKGRDKSAKAELWYQAQMRGLDTKGYSPNEADLKRLAGAKALEAEKIKEAGIDIKPKVQEKSSTKEENMPEETTPNKQGQSENIADTTKVSSDKNKDEPQTALSEQELLNKQIKNIVAEAALVADLDDKQVNILEESIMQGIAQAQSKGKKIASKNLSAQSEQVKKDLPAFRNLFDKSVNMEQKVIEKRELKQSEKNAIKQNLATKLNNQSTTQKKSELTR